MNLPGGINRKYIPSERVPNNRKMAVKTIERWGDPSALPFLVRLLKTEKHAGVRRFIVNALRILSGQKIGDDVSLWESYVKQFENRSQEELIRRHAQRETDGKTSDKE